MCLSLRRHPAVQAARTVLHSQLLSGGLNLVRDGEVLKEVKYGEKDESGNNRKGITKHFNQHLEEFWLPFARDVVDCFVRTCHAASHLSSAYTDGAPASPHRSSGASVRWCSTCSRRTRRSRRSAS